MGGKELTIHLKSTLSGNPPPQAAETRLYLKNNPLPQQYIFGLYSKSVKLLGQTLSMLSCKYYFLKEKGYFPPQNVTITKMWKMQSKTVRFIRMCLSITHTHAMKEREKELSMQASQHFENKTQNKVNWMKPHQIAPPPQYFIGNQLSTNPHSDRSPEKPVQDIQMNSELLWTHLQHPELQTWTHTHLPALPYVAPRQSYFYTTTNSEECSMRYHKNTPVGRLGTLLLQFETGFKVTGG